METNLAFSILRKAVLKAIENGYQTEIFQVISLEEYILHNRGLFFQLIFDHDFARAFFGEKHSYNCDICRFRPCPDMCPFLILNMVGWQEHLMKMVIEEDPLKYLEKFLEEK